MRAKHEGVDFGKKTLFKFIVRAFSKELMSNHIHASRTYKYVRLYSIGESNVQGNTSYIKYVLYINIRMCVCVI